MDEENPLQKKFKRRGKKTKGERQRTVLFSRMDRHALVQMYSVYRADRGRLLLYTVTYCTFQQDVTSTAGRCLLAFGADTFPPVRVLREWWRTPPPRQWLPHHRRWLASSNRSRWTVLPTMSLLTHTSPSKSGCDAGQLLTFQTINH